MLDLSVLSAAQRRALLDRVVRARRAATGQPYELTPGQRALWSSQALYPESTAWHVAVAFRLLDPVDPAALASAIHQVARRHDAVRTTIRLSANVPVQWIRQEWDGLQVVDAGTMSGDALLQAVTNAAYQPFDLEKGPLVRAVLFTRTDRTSVLLIAAHHIVLDLSSLTVLLDETAELYDALVRGRAPQLPAEPASYREYVTATTRAREPERTAALMAYWEGELRDVPPLSLPTDSPRTLRPFRPAGATGFRLERDLTSRVHAVAQRTGSTPFSVLLTGLQLLLHARSSQDVVAVGIPTTVRPAARFERTVGYFVNPVVIRADIGARATFDDLLAQTHARVLGALAHQDLPFADMVQRFVRGRDLTRSPLFDVWFVLQSARGVVLEEQRGRTAGASPFGVTASGGAGITYRWGGLAAERYRVGKRHAEHELSLEMLEASGALYGELSYDAGVYTAATARRLTDHFADLIDRMTKAPQARVTQLREVTAAERRLLRSWNATRLDWRDRRPLHQLVLASAARNPQALAMQYQGATITYGTLARRVQAMAQRLQAIGVAADDVVGVCLERSIDQVVALLGAVAAGGAYLPLEPEYPRARLEWVIGESAPRAIVAAPHTASLFDAGTAQVVSVDLIDEGRSTEAWQGADVEPEHLVYVIYTSGSTGRPKGAMNEHAAVCNRLLWMRQQLALTPDDRVLYKTPFGFDVSAWEIFLPLITGASLVIVPPGAHREPARLVAEIQRTGATVAHFVPSLLGPFLDEPGAAACTSLTRVVCSGEALSWELQEQFRRLLPHCELYNLYGPTEAAIDVTCHRCAGAEEPRPVSIGKPIANVSLHVVDRHVRLAPVGSPGELCIGGVAVGRGYIRQPALTAERFTPDAFSGAAGARVYRTGDLARWRDTGDLELLGRIDQQVKIRGHRIEPGEIGAALRTHPAVREAVVTVRAARPDGRLVAYYVPAGPPVDSASLRQHLGSQLPDYMVPHAFVALPRLPVTGNGKLDVKALPEPEIRPAAGSREPASAVERVLAQCWADVLGLDIVGVTDNFFELGGDSISSIAVASRARRAGVHVAPSDVLQHPTVAGLARVATTHVSESVSEPGTGPVPLTPIQRRFFDRDPGGRDTLVHMVALELPAGAAPSAVRRAVEALHDAHETLSFRFEQQEAEWVQYRSDEGASVLQVDVSALDASGQLAASRRIEAELPAAIALQGGPLFRAAMTETVRGRAAWLIVAAHHLVVDVLSWQAVLDDLDAAWSQIQSRSPVHLPCEQVFRRHAIRLDRAAVSSEVYAELPYWLTSAAAAPPGDRRDLDAQLFESVRVRFDQTETLAILQQAKRLHVRAADVVLAAYALAVRETTGVTRIVVDVEDHGRGAVDEGEWDRAVGWFTNIYPLALDRPTDDAVDAQAREVSRQVRAVPNRGANYGLLRYSRDAAVASALALLPRAELCFNFLGRIARTPSGSFRLCAERSGLRRGPLRRGDHALELTGFLAEGRLHLEWTHATSRRWATAAPEVVTRASRFLSTFAAVPATGTADPCLT